MDGSEQLRLEGALACVRAGLAATIERARQAPREPTAAATVGGESRRRAVECRLIDAIQAGAAS